MMVVAGGSGTLGTFVLKVTQPHQLKNIIDEMDLNHRVNFTDKRRQMSRPKVTKVKCTTEEWTRQF